MRDGTRWHMHEMRMRCACSAAAEDMRDTSRELFFDMGASAAGFGSRDSLRACDDR